MLCLVRADRQTVSQTKTCYVTWYLYITEWHHPTTPSPLPSALCPVPVLSLSCRLSVAPAPFASSDPAVQAACERMRRRHGATVMLPFAIIIIVVGGRAAFAGVLASRIGMLSLRDVVSVRHVGTDSSRVLPTDSRLADCWLPTTCRLPTAPYRLRTFPAYIHVLSMCLVPVAALAAAADGDESCSPAGSSTIALRQVATAAGNCQLSSDRQGRRQTGTARALLFLRGVTSPVFQPSSSALSPPPPAQPVSPSSPRAGPPFSAHPSTLRSAPPPLSSSWLSLWRLWPHSATSYHLLLPGLAACCGMSLPHRLAVLLARLCVIGTTTTSRRRA